MVAQATLNKQANALISLYEKLYREKSKREPTINRYRDRWGFLSMIEDLGYERAREIVEHYFAAVPVGHTIQKLLQNYDRFNRVLIERELDAAAREELRRETEERVKEWEAACGNKDTRST